MVCSKAERSIRAVVAGEELKALRAMQEHLSGKMICRNRPPSHDLLPSVSVQSRATSSISPSLCFGRPFFDAIKQPVCLEPALSMRPRCFEHLEGMALLLGAPRCPHHVLDRCLGWNGKNGWVEDPFLSLPYIYLSSCFFVFFTLNLLRMSPA